MAAITAIDTARIISVANAFTSGVTPRRTFEKITIGITELHVQLRPLDDESEDAGDGDQKGDDHRDLLQVLEDGGVDRVDVEHDPHSNGCPRATLPAGTERYGHYSKRV